jgi:hypothetical protein
MANKSDWELFCDRFGLTQKQMDALSEKQWKRYLEEVKGDQRLRDFVGRNLGRLDSYKYMNGSGQNDLY